MAYRMEVRVDGPSQALVDLTNAYTQAGDSALPRASAREAAGLARAARSALKAREPGVALALLDEMDGMLDGAEGSVYTKALSAKITRLRTVLEFAPTP